MNYRKIVNLYNRSNFAEIDRLALEFAHFDAIINFDGYHVFFNYGTLKIEHIIKAKDDLELRAYKYFSKQVDSYLDELKKLEHELQRNSRAKQASKHSRNQ